MLVYLGGEVWREPRRLGLCSAIAENSPILFFVSTLMFAGKVMLIACLLAGASLRRLD